MLSTSAPASADHLLDLLGRVRHHGQRAEREGGVRRLVHDDVVGDLMHERLALAERAQRLACAHADARQVEDVDRPVALADLGETVRDGGRCARLRRRAPRPRAAAPRASSAASVAEWVQPAPCVAADVVARDGDLEVPRPVEEMVDGDRRGRR